MRKVPIFNGGTRNIRAMADAEIIGIQELWISKSANLGQLRLLDFNLKSNTFAGRREFYSTV